MAETYSVKARLSATDNGFTSTLKNAINATDSLASKIKNGFAFGVLTGAGQQAFSMLTNGARNLVSEIDSSNAAWKTFTKNMDILGKKEDEINSVKKELQKFAETTIYSSSDMATTYAQLEAVGVKSTLELVKGFGGLASAAENPQQAMKTLSQQATQMAAKPSVAWADFKLMLEQTPAGIAAVAKEMNMSTSELVTAVQDGKVSTEAFFKAIENAGGSGSEFEKMATEAKTVGQAMDGLKETLGNKLTPSFELLTQKGIAGIGGIADKIAEIDGEKLATKLEAGLKAAQPYWESFKDVLSVVGGYVKKAGTFLAENKEAISKALPYVVQIALAFKGFSILKSVAPVVGTFSSALVGLAGKGIGTLAAKLLGISGAQAKVGKSSAASGKQMLAAAKSTLMMSAAVLLIAVGFALLAQSAIALSNAGGLAIGVMAGMAVGVAALMIGMMAMMKTITASPAKMNAMATAMLAMGAAVVLVAVGFTLLSQSAIALANSGGLAVGILVGMVAAIALLAWGAAAIAPELAVASSGLIAFGAAIALVGVGAVLAAASLAIISSVLPEICTYGMQGATTIAALGASMTVFAVGAAAAGVSSLALAAGLVGAAAGMVAFSAAMLAGVASTLAMAIALEAVESSMKTISKKAKSTEKSLDSMSDTVSVVSSGLDALGEKAKGAMKKITSAFDDSAEKAEKSGKNLGNSFADGMQDGLKNGVVVANSATAQIATILRAGYNSSYSSGAYISQGFALGMRSQLSAIQSAANKMVAAANKAIQAKAKIHSPSRLTDELGSYYGEGFVNGILGMVREAWNAAEQLVSAPNPQLAFAGGYSGGLNAEYDYSRKAEYHITVVSEMDGREVAKSTATYMQDELDRKQTRESRKQGRV